MCECWDVFQYDVEEYIPCLLGQRWGEGLKLMAIYELMFHIIYNVMHVPV